MHLRRSRFALPLLPLALVAPLLGTVLAAPATAARTVSEPDDLWSRTTQRPGPSTAGRLRTVNPSEYAAYTLDDVGLGRTLDRAPLENTAAAARPTTVEVPAPTGEMVSFAIVDSPVMERGLAAAHPEISTYAGTSTTDGYAASIRLDVTPAGFHAAVRSDQASWYVDPAYVGDDSLYLSYFGSSLPQPEKRFVEPELDEATKAQVQAQARPQARPQNVGEGAGAPVKRRVYRLALLTDPTYAEYVAPGVNDGAHDAESDAQVLAAKVTLMNRVDEIYNDDLAIKMVLVDGTDALNLNTAAKATGANGPCGAAACFTTAQLDPAGDGCTGALLDRQRYVIGLLAGASSFDIGHLALGINGGGLASLGVVGGDAKAQGCTGLPFPVGDFMAIDYVAHEMGHQFSGNHTFASTTLCGAGNRNSPTSVEPGGGSSVMAYAGICASDDLQPHSDPYFSQRTQTEVSAYVNGTPTTPNEVQMTALTGFDGTESFTLSFNGVQTAPIVRGSTYTAAGIKAAVQAVTGGTVTVAGFYGAGTLGDDGFRLTWSGAKAATDVANGALVPGAGFTGYASDITQGGPDTRGGGSVVTTGNHNPTVTAPAARTIPIRTPFALTGSAVDPDGDPMSYLWEQNDRTTSGTALISNNKTNGPLFRQFGTYADVSLAESLLIHSPDENLAGGTPTRVFPDMAQVLAGTTNAATGSCPTASAATTVLPGPALDCYSEFLPTAAYLGSVAAGNSLPPRLDFRLTARDMKDNGGGTQYADTTLTINPLAGPFAVTSQPSAVTYAGGSSQTVTWAVNGTDAAGLAPQVRITMSTDGGVTFDRVLSATTANDGTETVTIPNVATTTARIRIEAVDNYFFDVNDAPISITATAGILDVDDQVADSLTTRQGSGISASFSASSGSADAAGLVATATGLPAGLTLAKTAASAPGVVPGTSSWAVQGSVTGPPGSYPVSIDVTDGTRHQTVDFTVVVQASPVPDTRVSGPAGWLLATRATFGFTSTVSGSTFACRLDGAGRACSGSKVTLTGLSARSHRFTVAASKAGRTDASPASRVFTVPVDDRALTVAKGTWSRRSASAAYLGTYTQTSKKGAVLSRRVTKATQLALVVGTGRGYGRVRVLVGGKLVGTVNLAGATRARKLVILKTYAAGVSGRLTIVTLDAKPVRIEGLGVRTKV